MQEKAKKMSSLLSLLYVKRILYQIDTWYDYSLLQAQHFLLLHKTKAMSSSPLNQWLKNTLVLNI